MEGFPSLADHLLVLLFGWLLPFVSGVKPPPRSLEGFVFTDNLRRRFYLGNSLFLALSASLVLAAWALQGRPLSTMGFRKGLHGAGPPALTWALVAAVVLLYAADLVWNLRAARRNPDLVGEMEGKLPFLPKSMTDLPAYVIMCLAAAVCEEIMYRGFMVSYFLPAFNGREGFPFLALTVPAVLFSLAHLYQGWKSVAKILLMSLLLAGLFISSGSVWLMMALHFVIDLVSGIASMGMTGRLRNRQVTGLDEGNDEGS